MSHGQKRLRPYSMFPILQSGTGEAADCCRKELSLSLFGRRRLLFVRVFFLVYALFLLLMIAFGVFIYRLTAETIEQQMASRCAGIATAVATLIEQDADGYRNFIETLDTASPYYIGMKHALEKVRRGNRDNIKFLYTEVRASETEMMFVLDGEPEGSPAFSPPGERDELTDPRRAGYDSRSLVTGKFVTTGYGTLLSAYAPIHDPATGGFLGLVGVDVSLDHYRGIMDYFLVIIFTSIGMTILMVAAAIIVSSGRIERLITLDGLTGVYNKTFFLRHLKRQVQYARKKDEPLLVVMADLDHFKKLNDTYGHQFGDKALTETAKAIKSVLRELDCLARYGGEEFAAYFPGVTSKNAPFLLERIRQQVQDTAIHNTEKNMNVHATISIGAAYLGANQTVTEVLESADKALYRAKETRNTVVILSTP